MNFVNLKYRLRLFFLYFLVSIVIYKNRYKIKSFKEVLLSKIKKIQLFKIYSIIIEYSLDSLTGKIVACHVAEVGSRPTPRAKIRGLA